MTKIYKTMQALGAATLAASASMAAAQESTEANSSSGFSWEGEIELGYEQVFDSDVPANELRDTYAIFSFGASYTFGNGIELFTVLTAESLTDPTDNRAFDDMGLYIEELGLSFPIGQATTVSIGKVHPVFGSAWDDTAGFYGGSLAEDYELIEQIGILADVELAPGGVLSMGVFYADNTGLSKSVGFVREKVTVEDGGAGNTSELNNVALQWRQDFGNVFYQVGARYLSAGTGDVGDETGALAAIGATIGEDFSLFAEAAAFKNYRGSADDANYVTLNAAYYVNDFTFSGTLATRDLDSEGRTDLASVGLEYEFQNGWTLGGALALIDQEDTKDRLVGINLVIPLGG